MARVDTLGHFLTDVADAIREKTGSDALIEASDFDTEIESIPTGGGVDLSEYVTLNATNTSNSSNYWWETKFTQSKMSLVEITIGSNETGIAYMFSGCKWQYIPKLKGRKNYSSSFNMNYSFYNCTYVQSLDLSGITAKLNRLNYTFMGCNNLTFLDVRNMNFTELTSPTASFNNVPTNCLIIVKDATQKAWFTEKFSTLTNVKTVSEYEGG